MAARPSTGGSAAHRREGSGPFLAFATCWWRPPQLTWSGIPWNLRAGLSERGVDIVDIDVERAFPVKAALALTYRALPAGFHRKYGRLERYLSARAVRRGIARSGVAAVLTTGDLMVPGRTPSFVYQDSCFAVALGHYDDVGLENLAMVPARRSTLERLAGEQTPLLRELDGVLTMGAWYARFLVDELGLPRGRVHHVGAGIGSVDRSRAPRAVAPGGSRLLFVGREWRRKGGDLVVDACARLRQGGLPVTLTVAGPREPPVADPPDWLRFVGPQAATSVAQLYAGHDLFVMPSRFEPYGMSFLEAQAAGVPCVARDVFAMPEVVPDGVGGRLISAGGGAEELGATIAATLDDGPLYEGMPARADEVRAVHSWSAVAERVVAAIRL
ncbi:MAG: glycosyltransferase family 4 protein [Acidimicrobiia bacterium]|nr:glycosyltransferase family 4 protein [Acidimicrobiia bacterium]